MKKFFQFIGILTLICVSFFYTEKTVSVVSELDEIMIKIKAESSKHKIDSINPVIKDNTIIPGLNGRKINEQKSYYKMKKYGKYSENLLIYEKVKTKKSIKNYYDKYIVGGNKKKNMVSLIFIVDINDEVETITTILEKKNVLGNFFIDGYWLEDNNITLQTLSKKGHNIGNLSYDSDYTNKSFGWMNTIIKSVTKKQGYCLYNEDKETLNICKLNKSYTIKPSLIIDKKPLLDVKQKLKSGSIITIKINEITKRELGAVISLILSKGLKIVTLDELISEELENT